jgi:DNA end-binding protein Ku
MRPIWTGAISFGLINIPVKLFPAVHDSTLDLDMLDSRDHANIKFKRVNEDTGKEVPYDRIVKGFLLHDKYVVLDPEDFENADAKKTRTIEVLHFVDEQEIDPIYYEQPYYLEPEKSGYKAYGILRDALSQSGKVGITTFVLRNREALAILKPYDKAIVLNRIRFEEEIRDQSDLELPPVSKAKPKEQELANRLINQLTEKFDISNYKDEYTAKLMKIIKQKAKTGKSAKVPRMKVVHSQPAEDLMSMLKASLNEKRKAS